MALPIYLAMTAWEMAHREPPPHCGWMACHFSPYSRGMSNIPQSLPENALLLVNDRIPPAGHDPALIAQQLSEAVAAFSPRGILMDFQRPYNAETAGIVKAVSALPCPTAVTEPYAKEADTAVFLPPVPLNETLQQHLAPWQGRPVWLEAALSGLTMTLTGEGCAVLPGEVTLTEPVFTDKVLHCHYSIQVQPDRAIFSLERQKNDLAELLQAAEEMGVALAAGLYQELSPVLFVHDRS